MSQCRSIAHILLGLFLAIQFFWMLLYMVSSFKFKFSSLLAIYRNTVDFYILTLSLVTLVILIVCYRFSWGFLCIQSCHLWIIIMSFPIFYSFLFFSYFFFILLICLLVYLFCWIVLVLMDSLVLFLNSCFLSWKSSISSVRWYWVYIFFVN